MKIVFVGPSLPDAHRLFGKEVEIRPPACQGDVMRAIDDGAKAIGLVDGHFEFAAPVWHKELLFALMQAIPVLGASSMGALRAAECSAFGMIGIGAIFEDYRAGRREDDADVALLHGPAELAYPLLTVPIVNVDATTANAVALDLLTQREAEVLTLAARAIYFKDRSWKRIGEVAGFKWESLKPLISAAWVDQKRSDALLLLQAIIALPPGDEPVRDWTFNATVTWQKLYPSPSSR